ncbi:TrkA family potassium uptake protein [Paenibacillus sp. LHD-117]|uniref:potassium channel family protein n=1 Tax=Paenibacillus sp. LHD-117 TaxID=3071412 RepID=UPI0027E1E459|nr:TrkA family potassium uptake protein [Paenibacillus sp. LHD-117]MDQ6421292.1 TrkA family potassium uptake protein [Paenibacillus sp. LHD-117]
MKKKALIIGLGRFGSTVLKEMYSLGHEVVGCDKVPALLREVQNFAEYVVEGDACDDDVLDEMNVEQFDVIVVSTADDFESTILIVAKLKKRNCKHVIVKSNDRFRGEILSSIVGADHVIYPEEEAGIRLAKQLSLSSLKEYIELSSLLGGIDTTVPDDFVNKSLLQLNIRQRFGVTILYILRNNNAEPIVSPAPTEVFQEGDRVFLVGKPADLHKFQKYYAD